MSTLKSPARPLVFAAALAGAGAFASYWFLLWTARGSYPTALIMLAVSLWGFGFAAFYVSTGLGVEIARTASDEAGTVLRPRKLIDVANAIASVGITCAAALHLIFAPLGKVEYVTSGLVSVLPLGCVVLVLWGVPVLYQMVKHKGAHYLRLTPAGYEVWNSHWNSFRRGTWDEIEQILDHKPKGGKPLNELVVFVPSDGPNAVLYADTVTDDSDALREWVRFYWEHPEYRDELVDDRGLRRLEEQKFTVG